MPAALFDTNVWIAAVFSTHPFHDVARRRLLDATPSSPAIFCRATQISFLRLASTPTLHRAYGAEGMSNNDALVALNVFEALEQVRVQDEPAGTVTQWHAMAGCSSASPKVWMDAYLAAFAIAGGLRLLTLDRDFGNFVSNGLDLELITP